MSDDIVRVEIHYVPADRIRDVWPKCLVGDVEGFLPITELELIDTPGLQRVTNRPVGHPRVLESVYSSYQRLEGDVKTERVEQLKQRSMSVGDAIVIENEVYYVASLGFVQIQDGNIVEVKSE